MPFVYSSNWKAWLLRGSNGGYNRGLYTVPISALRHKLDQKMIWIYEYLWFIIDLTEFYLGPSAFNTLFHIHHNVNTINKTSKDKFFEVVLLAKLKRHQLDIESSTFLKLFYSRNWNEWPLRGRNKQDCGAYPVGLKINLTSNYANLWIFTPPHFL